MTRWPRRCVPICQTVSSGEGAGVKLVLGVDGGNTKTIAAVASLDGAVLGVGMTGCGDIYGARTVSAALTAIDDAVTEAMVSAGANDGQLAAAAFGLAGGDWPEDLGLYRDHAVHVLGHHCPVTVNNDGLGPLRLGSFDGVGVSVAVGTGCAIGSRGPTGLIWHGGFWIDGKGGETLGERGLRAVYRAEMGLGPPTSLTGPLLNLYGQDDVEQLLHSFTHRCRRPEGKPRALAAPIVLREAQRGDEVARAVVDQLGAEIASWACCAAERAELGHTGFPLILTGGVLRGCSERLTQTIVAGVQSRFERATPVLPRLPPVAGVVLEAIATAGAQPDAGMLEQLQLTMPETARPHQAIP